ncbi:MAG: ferritin-like domain-containing protein [Thermoleophilaceae bacterium]|nr:ferritin-like domain-containing protein [Thermoleophilaceae bacterium]
MTGGLTRRGVLAGAALAVSSCGGGDAPPARGPRPGSGVGLLNSVLALEHATVAAYDALARRLAAPGRAAALAIARQEREHVARLSEVIAGLGGTPVEGRPPESYASSFPVLDDAADALLLARDVEERLVRAYLDALTKLPAGPLRREAAGLATSEAEHLAVVQGLQGQPLAAQAFVTGTS